MQRTVVARGLLLCLHMLENPFSFFAAAIGCTNRFSSTTIIQYTERLCGHAKSHEIPENRVRFGSFLQSRYLLVTATRIRIFCRRISGQLNLFEKVARASERENYYISCDGISSS